MSDPAARAAYQSLLEKVGIPLSTLGVRDVALPRAEALTAIDLLRTAGVPILGGDVYIRTHDRIECAYAPWHAEPGVGEEAEAFVARSCESSRLAVLRIPEPKDGEVLFVLVELPADRLVTL